jgi:hypothetical protein
VALARLITASKPTGSRTPLIPVAPWPKFFMVTEKSDSSPGESSPSAPSRTW